MQQSPETIQRIAEWRHKAAEGTLSLDEMKAAIIFLRSGRRAASEAAVAARRTKGPAKSADALLGELDGL